MATAARVSVELQTLAKAIDRHLELTTGEKHGFFLFVYAGGEVNYVSSDGDRPRVAKAMREIIAKWEAGTPDTPAHQRN